MNKDFLKKLEEVKSLLSIYKNSSNLPKEDLPKSEDKPKEEEPKPKKPRKKKEVFKIPDIVLNFLPKSQVDSINFALKGEEKEHFIDVVKSLEKTIIEMPKVYESKEKGKEKIVFLHYFKGDSDWYIVEKDSEEEQLQAYGYVVLNGDTSLGEFGYISIEELKSINAELDLYFEPKKLSKALGEQDKSKDDDGDLKEWEEQVETLTIMLQFGELDGSERKEVEKELAEAKKNVERLKK